MALVLQDRVKETSTTASTGTFTLAGASTGFQSFAAVGNGNTTYYAIVSQTLTEWEVGIGTYTLSGTTLSRTTVLASSNGGSLVNFSAGTKDVFVTYPAEKSVNLDAAGNASALGTPVSFVGTNITGTATSFTASNVTTNANLTGGVTSVGNAATVITNANLTGGVTSVGNAATVVTNANLTGDVTSTGNATTVGKINGTSLAVLATGILKNTTTTGVPSIAIAADFPTLNQNTTGNAATVTTNANLTGGVTSVGNAATVVTNANLTGEATSVGNATTLTNSAVIAKVLTGYTSGAGTVSATDTLLQAIQKLNGNTAAVVGGAALSNDTATATNVYPMFAAATTGTPTTVYTSNAKLLYKPSTGEFQASVPVALNGLFVNATTLVASYTVASGQSAQSVGGTSGFTIPGGLSVTLSSGSRWVVL